MKSLRRYTILLFLLLPGGSLVAQDYLTLQGRIVDSRTRKAVPYAAVMLQGTNVGTQGNDNGQWRLKVESGKWNTSDEVVFSAIGYKKQTVSIGQLQKSGDVRLEPHATELREVQVTAYVTPQEIIAEAVRRIPENYHTDTTVGTWFRRDWRMLDGELYLFDESVIDMLRYGYAHDTAKRYYALRDSQREMDDNYKAVRKHRLLVFDSLSVRLAAGDMKRAMADMDYSDNHAFTDPMATPQAVYGTSENSIKKQKFDPIREYTDADGTAYWLLRGYGRSRNANVKAHYTLRIRQDNFAITDYLFESDTATIDSPYILWQSEPWSSHTVHRSTQQLHYELRGDRYCLTHMVVRSDYTYRCHRHFGYELAAPEQRRETYTEWLLTDLQPADTSFLRHNEVQGHRRQNLDQAFGRSSYDDDFWGRYNTLPMDTAVQAALERFFAVQTRDSGSATLVRPGLEDSLAAMRTVKDTTAQTMPPLPRWVFYRYGGIGGNRFVGEGGKSRRGISQQLGLGTRLHLGGRFHLYADLQYAWMHTKADFGHLNTHSLTLPLRLSFDWMKPTLQLDCRFYVAVGGWGRYTFFGHVGNDTGVMGRDLDRWDWGWSWTIGIEFFRTFALEWTSYRSLHSSILAPGQPDMQRHNGAFTLSINF